MKEHPRNYEVSSKNHLTTLYKCLSKLGEFIIAETIIYDRKRVTAEKYIRGHDDS